MKRRQIMALLALGIPASALGIQASEIPFTRRVPFDFPNAESFSVVSWVDAAGKIDVLQLLESMDPPVRFVVRRTGWAIIDAKGEEVAFVPGPAPVRVTLDRHTRRACRYWLGESGLEGVETVQVHEAKG